MVYSFDRYNKEDLVEIADYLLSASLKKAVNSRKNLRLFNKILRNQQNLPYPGDLKQIIKTAVAFSDDSNEYDYLRKIYFALNPNVEEQQLQKLRNNMQIEDDEKYKNENYEKYVDKQYIDIWENSVKLWESSFNNIDSILDFAQLEKTMDIEKILLECGINENNASSESVILKKVDKIYDITLASFKSICQDIIQKKLMYSAVQEYNDHLIDYDYGDEVNYLAFASNKNKKDLTLISFKRWKNTEVGELIIRDFILLINEAGAKNGILILPVELTSSARSYAMHNNKIKVYTRNQFNYMLRDSKF